MNKLFLFLLFPLILQAKCLREVTVAVIDTGIDSSHPYFKGHIKDGGKNFLANNKDITDNHGHGTHIAGLVLGAYLDLKKPHECIKVLPLKYYDTQQTINTIDSTINAINYAVKQKVDIINYSSGGSDKNVQEKNAIIKAREAGILFVAAAGNDHRSIIYIPYYPASYALGNIISVSAITINRNLAFFSNYDANVSELGIRVNSTYLHNKWETMSGTSSSAAIISYYAADLLSKNPTYNYTDLKLRLIDLFKERK